jgi:hypothetical protein
MIIILLLYYFDLNIIFGSLHLITHHPAPPSLTTHHQNLKSATSPTISWQLPQPHHADPPATPPLVCQDLQCSSLHPILSCSWRREQSVSGSGTRDVSSSRTLDFIDGIALDIINLHPAELLLKKRMNVLLIFLYHLSMMMADGELLILRT